MLTKELENGTLKAGMPVTVGKTEQLRIFLTGGMKEMCKECKKTILYYNGHCLHIRQAAYWKHSTRSCWQTALPVLRELRATMFATILLADLPDGSGSAAKAGILAIRGYYRVMGKMSKSKGNVLSMPIPFSWISSALMQSAILFSMRCHRITMA